MHPDDLKFWKGCLFTTGIMLVLWFIVVAIAVWVF